MYIKGEWNEFGNRWFIGNIRNVWKLGRYLFRVWKSLIWLWEVFFVIISFVFIVVSRFWYDEVMLMSLRIVVFLFKLLDFFVCL